jgi:TetR/AcrR family fatty acid metabolism transcriptional regulator
MPPRNKDKRKKILQAATKVFARNGFYHSKVSEIAREADVADGTIYLYFKNKEDILISIFEESMDQILTLVREEIDKEADALTRLRRFVRLHMALMEKNPRLAEVIQVELRQSSKFMKEYKNVKFLEYLQFIAEVIAQGQREGLIHKEISPAIFKRMLFGALDELALQWVLSKKRYSLAAVAEQVTDIFVKGIAVGASGNAMAGTNVEAASA